MRAIALCLLCLCFLPGCALVAVGAAGAAVGAAAVSEGGISGSAQDAQIGALIRDAWFRYDTDTFGRLNLTVKEGDVFITGVVQDPQKRVEAVRIAWGVEGVRKVTNEIQVADSEGVEGFARDTWITTRLRSALIVDQDIKSFNYSIDTIQGTVYLMGYAATQEELNRASEIAGTIPGVVQVVSYVRVRGNKPSQTP